MPSITPLPHPARRLRVNKSYVIRQPSPAKANVHAAERREPGTSASPGWVDTAIVFSDPEETRIASLTVQDRLVVSLSRTGVKRIIMIGDIRPRLARSAQMGLQVEHALRPPPGLGKVLVASGNVLVTATDLQQVIEQDGWLTTEGGQPLPLGVIDGNSLELAVLHKQMANGQWPRTKPEVRARDFAALITRDSAGAIEQAYWRSLTSSSDGWVDRNFNRPVGRLLSRKLVHGFVTPNQVSLVSTAVGLVAAGLFSAGTLGTAIAGAVVLQLSAILDCIDGDLARALYKQSVFGKWLDIVGDQVVHIAVFLGIGLGLWRSGSSAPVLLLASVAVVGVLLSFLMVLRVLLKPSRRGRNRLQKLIDATTNRDFSVLLFCFALFGVLDWFLWIAAVGSHLFWLTAAGLQLKEWKEG
jgi:phosphatidylglycerophosphate synthase